MPTNEALILPAGVELRRLPPPHRRRFAAPEWDVLLDGRTIGRVQQWRTDTATATFYRAAVLHRDGAQEADLGSDTDLADRIATITAVHRDPSLIAENRWRRRSV